MALINHFENDNIAVIEVYDHGQIYEGAVPLDQMPGRILSIGTNIPVHSIAAQCTTPVFDIDGNIYFRFDGNEETWTLSDDELGIIPEKGMYYTLYVSDNGTTSCTHGNDCECYIYDDFFICLGDAIPW
jgi:hypothetical protein